MKETGLICCAESVQAILDGRKTMTRRVIVPQPVSMPVVGLDGRWYGSNDKGEAVIAGGEIKCPYGGAGDVLRVKESIRHYGNEVTAKIAYVEYTDGCHREIDLSYMEELPHRKCWLEGKSNWSSPRFMPSWAARLWREITSVRVERVQEISDNDAKAEGCKEWHSNYSQIEKWNRAGNYRNSFHALWDSINEQRGYGWGVNPWVWVIEFKRMQKGGSNGIKLIRSVTAQGGPLKSKQRKGIKRLLLEQPSSFTLPRRGVCPGGPLFLKGQSNE